MKMSTETASQGITTEIDVPRVLFVDDSDQIEISELRRLLQPYRIQVRLRHPEETLMVDLDWADLVVVDYFLTSWSERDDIDSVARKPCDGLAAVASMRSVLLPKLSERLPGTVPPRTVAFALWSSNLKEATFELPEVVLPHVFSRENNLEWAFRRDDLLQEQGNRQIALLAHAVKDLPDRWPSVPSRAEQQMLTMLGFTSDNEDPGTAGADLWKSDARNEVLNCRPPVHELSERSHGLALLRWLLHRIFPYPCFLLDEQQLCARLRVDALEGGSVSGASLAEVLLPYQYSGMLAGFGGTRWWRSGIEDWVFNETDGQSGVPSIVAELARRHGATASRSWRRPVIVLNGDLSRSREFVEVEQTVRIRPDDWPVFADDAFALREQAVEDPKLRALVQPADQRLLDRAAIVDDAT
jgi:hypothetical protein